MSFPFAARYWRADFVRERLHQIAYGITNVGDWKRRKRREAPRTLSPATWQLSHSGPLSLMKRQPERVELSVFHTPFFQDDIITPK